ncbi:MAG TPA: LytTR family DNA-binding domain-containing protein [Holophagaceae bacterium]|jgi:two-component system LytT family response regulator|nr:LytTR family DNA-binding domain-containing protein [Holophagaceae bacterium]
MNIRALIVDDEPLARQRLRDLLADESGIEVVGECGDGGSAVVAIEAQAPDLVFLDVQMPELDGFEVIESVGADRMPATLFVTAHDRHALKAFEVHAIDYLLKPFDRKRFHEALERARIWVGRSHEIPARMASLLQDVQDSRPPLERILVRSGDHHLLLKTTDIQWIEAEDNYVRLHVEGTSYLVRQTMGRMLERLDPARFKRIHRSSIVNLDCVKELRPWFHGDYLVLLSDGTKLTMPRTYREQIVHLK